MFEKSRKLSVVKHLTAESFSTNKPVNILCFKGKLTVNIIFVILFFMRTYKKLFSSSSVRLYCFISMDFISESECFKSRSASIIP